MREMMIPYMLEVLHGRRVSTWLNKARCKCLTHIK